MRRTRGVTLTELLITMAIILILASLLMVAARKALMKAMWLKTSLENSVVSYKR